MTMLSQIDALVDDRAAEGIFRVRREIFTDPAIFDLEMKHIFGATWLFIGLESQVARPHDFFTTMMGAQPVIVMRDGEGQLRCFLNTCRHRGAQVTSLACGNQRVHACPYHGWSYTSGGANCAIPKAKEGNYPASFAAENHDLIAVPRFANYRGMLFASLSADVPSIEDHLGQAKVFPRPADRSKPARPRIRARHGDLHVRRQLEAADRQSARRLPFRHDAWLLCRRHSRPPARGAQ